EVGGRAARLDGAEALGARDAAREIEQFAGADTHRDAVHAGPFHVTRDCEEFQARVVATPLRLPPRRAPDGDDRDVGERLDRVHQRGLAVQAVGAGERRLVPRFAAVPLHALDQRGLLAEDVAAGGGEYLDAESLAGASCVRADQPGLAEPVDLAPDDLLLRAVLVPDEYPALFGADRE